MVTFIEPVLGETGKNMHKAGNRLGLGPVGNGNPPLEWLTWLEGLSWKVGGKAITRVKVAQGLL